MMTAEERYIRDPMFRSMVNYLKQLIALSYYTPTELREALILAAAQYYNEHPRPLYITASEFVQAAKSLISLKRESAKEPQLFAADQDPTQPHSNMQTNQLSEETIAALNLDTDEETFLALMQLLDNDSP